MISDQWYQWMTQEEHRKTLAIIIQMSITEHLNFITSVISFVLLQAHVIKCEYELNWEIRLVLASTEYENADR